MGKGFGRDKKLLSFTSALPDHLVDSVAQGNLVIVEPRRIDVPDTDFKTFFEQVYKSLFILDFVGTYSDEWKYLLVGKKKGRWCLLLVFLLFFSHE